MNDCVTPNNGSVMIVDDAPGNLAFLSDALQDAGYQVLVATDGAVALEQLQYVTPDVILMDAVMPGLDGFETCRRLQADPALGAIPVIFMTALSDLEYLLKAFSEGAVDYLVKPIRHQEVLARVAAHIAVARRARRATDMLEHGGLAALAVTEEGSITWLTGAAIGWLAAVCGGEAGVGLSLPHPLRHWLLSHTQRSVPDAPAVFSCTRQGHVYSASVAATQTAGEHLVLLESKPTEWDLAAMRGSLGLTLREAEVIMWIARGKTNKDVAQILGSSSRTVNKHLEHIFTKLGVETRTAAVSVVLDKTRNGHLAAGQRCPPKY